MSYNGCMAEEIERTEDSERVRKLIWRHMGVRSAREIAELTGVPPETVLRVKRELLEEVDVLSIQEKRQRIIIELEQMARESRERAQGMNDEFYASGVQASVAAMRLVLGELKLMEKQDNAKVETLNQKRVQALVQLVRDAVDTSVYDLSARFDIDPEEMFSVFNQNLLTAANRLDPEQ